MPVSDRLLLPLKQLLHLLIQGVVVQIHFVFNVFNLRDEVLRVPWLHQLLESYLPFEELEQLALFVGFLLARTLHGRHVKLQIEWLVDFNPFDHFVVVDILHGSLANEPESQRSISLLLHL